MAGQGGTGPHVTVRRVRTARDREAFLRLPYDLYARDPAWRPPLRAERETHLRRHLSGREPTARHALFLAEDRGRPVGRIAAFVNRAHEERYADGAGHFGLLDARHDAVPALLAAAEDHLRSLGCAKAVGPYDLTINEQIGLPETGTDTPPMLMMPYAREGLCDLVLAQGYEKAVRLNAYLVDLDAHYPRPPVVQRMQAQTAADPAIRLRRMEPANFLTDVRTAMSIFNDAWSQNWGFLPFTDDQVTHMAGELKPLLTPDNFWIAEKDGEAAAFVVMVPNVNEAARDLNGRLAPFGWAKLLWRLKRDKVETSRMMLMGLRREHQKSRAGVAMVASLFEEAFAANRKRGVKTCEMSWVLEGNRDVQRLIALSGADLYKTYLMVEKTL